MLRLKQSAIRTLPTSIFGVNDRLFGPLHSGLRQIVIAKLETSILQTTARRDQDHPANLIVCPEITIVRTQRTMLPKQ